MVAPRTEKIRPRTRARRGRARAIAWMAAALAVVGGAVAFGHRMALHDAGTEPLTQRTGLVAASSILPSPAFTFHELHVAGVPTSLHQVQWQVNGRDAGVGPVLAPRRFVRGDVVSAQVVVDGEVGPLLSTTIANAPPRIESLVLERGTTDPGVVVARHAVSDPDGDALSVRHRWRIDGEEVPNATGHSLAVGDAGSGRAVTVELTVSDGSTAVQRTSAAFTGRFRAPTLEVAGAPDLEISADNVRRAALTVRGADPDGGSADVTLVRAPEGVAFDPARSKLVWELREGTEVFDVVLRAIDGAGSTAERTITLRR